jgi:hypothetical protein
MGSACMLLTAGVHRTADAGWAGRTQKCHLRSCKPGPSSPHARAPFDSAHGPGAQVRRSSVRRMAVALSWTGGVQAYWLRLRCHDEQEGAM